MDDGYLDQQYIIKDDECKNGDIITVLFNGNNWTLSFLLNGETRGKPISLRRLLEYSPFISINSDDADYTIVYDQTW